jgi:hypothetical protein
MLFIFTKFHLIIFQRPGRHEWRPYVEGAHIGKPAPRRSGADSEIFAMPFSALAQSCKTYDEYGERIASAQRDHIELVAIGLIGPKKKITRLTGNLKLYR